MNKTKFLLQAAIIAAIYAALTIALAPISYGPMQVRIAEALTVLPAITPAAIPGLFIGCALANILGPYGALDIILGSTASLIAAVSSYLLRSKPWLVPLPP
ncbi:MAG: QueT transporter family protein, partial [Anaerovoracaceae bacterium]